MARLAALLFFASVLICPLWGTAFAQEEPFQRIAEDFSLLDGVLVLEVGGRWIVDLDANDGLSEGDLFRIAEKAEPIIHPKTGEVLGYLDASRGLLRVAELKSGYSYLIPMARSEYKKGDAVRRFENVPARFVGSSVDDEILHLQLKKTLPHLAWQATPVAEDFKGITFSKKGSRVRALGADGAVVQIYTQQSTPTPALAVSLPVAALAVPGVPVVEPKLAAPVDRFAPEQSKQSQSTATARTEIERAFRSQALTGTVTGLAAEDFDADGQIEIAVSFKDRIDIYRLSGDEFELVSGIDAPAGLDVLALDAASISPENKPSLFVTASKEDKVASFVLTHDVSGYRIVETSIGFFFRSVHLPGKGKTLIGQTLNDGDYGGYSGKPFEVVLSDGRVAKGEQVYVPGNISVHGTAIDVIDQQKFYVSIGHASKLTVTDAQGERQWQSNPAYGGSEIYVERYDDAGSAIRSPDFFFLEGRIEPLGQGAFLLAQNEGSRYLSNTKKFDSGRLLAMKWNGFDMEELWSTKKENGYLVDFLLIDINGDQKEELLSLVQYVREGWSTKAKAALVIYPVPAD